MAYQPDARPRLARATRFFARVVSFDLECPACGTVYSVRKHAIAGKWDPATARFSCTKADCEKTFVLGLLAWPVAPRGATQPPTDQVPNLRQLAEMRREGGGWWMEDDEKQRYRRPQETNLTTQLERPDLEDGDDE